MLTTAIRSAIKLRQPSNECFILKGPFKATISFARDPFPALAIKCMSTYVDRLAAAAAAAPHLCAPLLD
jgi:hypothetical protein